MGAVKSSIKSTIGGVKDVGKFAHWRTGRALRVLKASKFGMDPVAGLKQSAKNVGQDMTTGFGLMDTSVQKSTDPTFTAPPDTQFSDASRAQRAARVQDQLRRARLVSRAVAPSLYGQNDIY